MMTFSNPMGYFYNTEAKISTKGKMKIEASSKKMERRREQQNGILSRILPGLFSLCFLIFFFKKKPNTKAALSELTGSKYIGNLFLVGIFYNTCTFH
jgi:hypothetical protein